VFNFIYALKYLPSKIFPSSGLLDHVRDTNIYYTVNSVEMISLCLWFYDGTVNNSLFAVLKVNLVLFALPNGIKICS
jgi:hypothetical protein